MSTCITAFISQPPGADECVSGEAPRHTSTPRRGARRPPRADRPKCLHGRPRRAGQLRHRSRLPTPRAQGDVAPPRPRCRGPSRAHPGAPRRQHPRRGEPYGSDHWPQRRRRQRRAALAPPAVARPYRQRTLPTLPGVNTGSRSAHARQEFEYAHSASSLPQLRAPSGFSNIFSINSMVGGTSPGLSRSRPVGRD